MYEHAHIKQLERTKPGVEAVNKKKRNGGNLIIF